MLYCGTVGIRMVLGAVQGCCTVKLDPGVVGRRVSEAVELLTVNCEVEPTMELWE